MVKSYNWSEGIGAFSLLPTESNNPNPLSQRNNKLASSPVRLFPSEKIRLLMMLNMYTVALSVTVG